jgi:hypothetical protein
LEESLVVVSGEHGYVLIKSSDFFFNLIPHTSIFSYGTAGCMSLGGIL